MLRTLFLVLLLTNTPQMICAESEINPTVQYDEDLGFNHLGGGLSHLEDFKGKLLLVHFWATWCGSCIQEMPSLREFNASLKEKKIHLLMVSTDFGSGSTLKKFLHDKDMEAFDVVQDPQLAQYFNVRGIPTTIIINSKGQEIDRLVGPVNWQSDDMKEKLEKLVAYNEALKTPEKKDKPDA